MSAWAVVGAEVVERHSGWGPVFTYGVTGKIGKVYKNGNIVLEGDSQQWRVFEKHASKTGGSGWHSSRTDIVPLTDATRKDMERSAEFRAAREVLEVESKRLERIARSSDVDAVIAEAARLPTPSVHADARRSR